MLEYLRSRNGHPIIKFEQRYLCSHVDPIVEAESWVTSNQKFFSDHLNLCVLGLGCGYHIQELRNRFPKLHLIVIEADERLINFVEAQVIVKSLDVSIVNLKNIDGFERNGCIRRMVTQGFGLLTHPSTQIVAATLYEQAKSLLLGRDPKGFLWQLSLKAPLEREFKFLDKDKSLSSLLDNELVSIKSMEKMLGDSRSEVDQPYFIVKALKEFVV